MAADPRVLHLRSRMAHVLRGLLALLRRMDDDADGETEKQIRALFDASPAAPELPAAPAAFELPRRQSRGDSRHSGATDDPDDVGFGRFRTSEPQPRPARAKEAASAPAPPAPDVVPAAPRLPTRHALVSVLEAPIGCRSRRRMAVHAMVMKAGSRCRSVWPPSRCRTGTRTSRDVSSGLAGITSIQGKRPEARRHHRAGGGGPGAIRGASQALRARA